jgi:isopropylmalate/homocitrate/citramalate synthase
MHAFAQTNLQLINQLQDSGYPPAELKFVVASQSDRRIMETIAKRLKAKELLKT